MKILSFVCILIVGLTFSAASFADCYSCSSGQSSCTQCLSSYNGKPCYRCQVSSNDCATTNSCACTEPSCGKNPCLSRQTCCYVYGNVGAYSEE